LRRLLGFSIVGFLGFLKCLFYLFPRFLLLLFAELFFLFGILDLDLLCLDLVVYKVVQRNDRANHIADIHDMHVVVGLDREVLDDTVYLKVWQEVEYVL